jgi:GNAT superfamily N-acetyltransferase
VAITLRPAVAGDAEACGRAAYAAFKEVDERHGFAPAFPSVEVATRVARLFIDLPAIHGIVAEVDGRVAGSVFLDEGDPIRSVGLVSVDPSAQARGVGRRLLEAALARAGDAIGVRLVQEPFNTGALGLYASLGFVVREPLVTMTGHPRSQPRLGTELRALTTGDLDACATLCRSVHGIDRTTDLEDAIRLFTPRALVRDGRITAYTYLIYEARLAWGVAETAEDMEALLLALGASAPAPLRFNVPARDTRFFRWCLAEGLRIERPLTLMARGWYQEPRGPYFPSGFY